MSFVRLLPALAFACVVLLPTLPSSAAEVETGAVLRSASLWRGLTLNDGMVLQPGLDARFGPGLFIRGDLDVDLGTFGGQRERGDISKVELAFGVAPRFGPVLLEVGMIELLYPGGPPSTRELMADVRLDIAFGLRVRMAMHGDIRQAEGFFFRGGIEGDWEFGPGFFADASALAGLATRRWAVLYGGRSGGLHHLMAEARLGWRPAPSVDLFVAFEATTPGRESVLPSSRAPQSTSFGAGVMTRF